MRIFLPDDRKIAAKPTSASSSPKSNSSLSPKYNTHLHTSSSQTTIQASNKKEDRHQLQEFNVKDHHDSLELGEEERPYKKLKSDLSFGSMGGGGRLTSSSTTNNSKLKSSSAHSSGEQNAQQQQQGQRNNDTIASLDLRDDELNIGSNHDGPHAAVAAAASSPHRSTISTSTSNRRNDNTLMNPEDDYLEESKQSSSQYIFLGKSDTNNDMPAPRLNGPIPGSSDDPATISKSSQEYITMNVDNNNADDENVSVLSRFIHLLRTQHKPPLDMVEMDGDGNCLFRAISLSVYGDATMHSDVRRSCLDFMEREADHFRSFVADEDFDEYIARKRLDGVHGNHTEIQAMSELYNRSIEVFVPKNGIEPINIFHSEYKSADAPIRLAYTDSNHYNAVIDPLLPTAGLGLGLPGLQPGLADKLQLEEAKKVSDESAMEEKMRLAVEESNRASKAREENELKEALRKSSELTTNLDSDDDLYKKKAMYLSELDQADFDLEQAVLASSLESWQERKPSSSRRGLDGRRNRFNNSPRSHRSSSNSPTFRSSPHAASAAAASSSSNYAAAASSSAAAASSSQAMTAPSNNTLTNDESVQELVMNGFELSKVLHAYSLIGDNFDDLLSFLLSSAT